MCILVYTKGKRRLTQSEFNNCWDSNPEGFGMAWRETIRGHKVIRYAKGFMRWYDALKAYERMQHFDDMVLHFRIATAGGVCKDLTHPFLISGSSPIMLDYTGQIPVLFHNGCVSDWYKKAATVIHSSARPIVGLMSDSRYMALAISRLRTMNEKIKFLEKDWSKYIIYTPTETHMVGTFNEEKDAFFSNYGFRSYYHYGTSSYYANKKDKTWYNPKGETWEDKIGAEIDAITIDSDHQALLDAVIDEEEDYKQSMKNKDALVVLDDDDIEKSIYDAYDRKNNIKGY
jgi:predicted glutamine amidotransferase